MNNAKQLNPLSGLPGNLLVEQRLKYFISCKNIITAAYIDIDNFKAINDIYGFESGDIVIKLLADILRNNIPKEQFIGHVGGDDFAVIIYGLIKESYFDSVVRQFEQEVLCLYNQRDLERGHIVTVNRRGELEQFPLLSLTMSLTNNRENEYKYIIGLTESLAKQKREIKNKKLALFTKNSSMTES